MSESHHPSHSKKLFFNSVGDSFSNPALGLLWIRRSSSQKTDFKYTATKTLSGHTMLQTAIIKPMKYSRYKDKLSINGYDRERCRQT